MTEEIEEDLENTVELNLAQESGSGEMTEVKVELDNDQSVQQQQQQQQPVSMDRQSTGGRGIRIVAIKTMLVRN